MFFKILPLLIFVFFIPTNVFARVTPDQIYQAKRAEFEENLAKIQDSGKKQAVHLADQLLKEINLQISSRFDMEVVKLAAILEEEKKRQNVTSTVVAYGRGDTPLDTAAYYINYAAEAVAYQKIKDYTPQIKNGNLKGGVNTSLENLKSDLIGVQRKIIRAKSETKKALDYYEK